MYVCTRKNSINEIDTGAVALEVEIDGPAIINRVHLTFSEAPADEDCTISVVDTLGSISASHTFTPLDLAILEVTRVFLGWEVGNGGGAVNVVFANTGNTLERVVVSYDRS